MGGVVRRLTSLLVVLESVAAFVLFVPVTANANDGDPSAHFGVGGIVHDTGALTSGGGLGPLGLPLPNSSVVAATDDALGSIYLAFSGPVAGVVKYRFDGERDTSFGVNGVLTFDPQIHATPRDLAVREDGSIVVGGSFYVVNADPRSYAVVNKAGTTVSLPEPVLVLPPPSPTGTELRRSVVRVVALADGRVILTGSTMAGLEARVLEPNGFVWSALVVATPPLNSTRFVQDALVLADGRVLVQINSSQGVSCQIFALTASLAPEPGFGNGGMLELTGPCGQLAAEPTGTWLSGVSGSLSTISRYSASGQLLDTEVLGGPILDLDVDGTGRVLVSMGSLLWAFYPDFTVDYFFGVDGSADVNSGVGAEFFLMVSGDVLFYRGDSLSGVRMQVFDDPYGVAPQPPALPMSSLVSLSPTRILDTRKGIGAPQVKPGSDGTVDVQVAGFGGVPNDGSVVSVVLNVTAAASVAAGFVTVWPTGAALPTVSSLNYGSDGEAVPNLVTVELGQGGRISLYTYASAHLIVDVLGYYLRTDLPVSGGRFQPLEPLRIVDTRQGQGLPMTPIPSGGSVDVQLTGTAGIPASGVSAVAFNLTATRSLATGFLTVHPGGTALPDASNLNVVSGGTRANFVISPVGPDGKVTIFNNAGGDLIIDVVGWFTDESVDVGYDGLFVPISSRRIADSRFGGANPWLKNGLMKKQVGSTSVGPAYGIAAAVVLNLTLTASSQAGFITVWPTGIPEPTVSSVNVGATLGDTANAAIVVLGINDGGFQVDFQTTTHLVVDMVGYYLAY
ncbi:MAG: hypothetical protein HY826_12525 [Actinobacteria bacterium]|nr:hypothetical protein [Actinomycetota bacterium]